MAHCLGVPACSEALPTTLHCGMWLIHAPAIHWPHWPTAALVRAPPPIDGSPQCCRPRPSSEPRKNLRETHPLVGCGAVCESPFGVRPFLPLFIADAGSAVQPPLNENNNAASRRLSPSTRLIVAVIPATAAVDARSFGRFTPLISAKPFVSQSRWYSNA